MRRKWIGVAFSLCMLAGALALSSPAPAAAAGQSLSISPRQGSASQRIHATYVTDLCGGMTEPGEILWDGAGYGLIEPKCRVSFTVTPLYGYTRPGAHKICVGAGGQPPFACATYTILAPTPKPKPKPTPRPTPKPVPSPTPDATGSLASMPAGATDAASSGSISSPSQTGLGLMNSASDSSPSSQPRQPNTNDPGGAGDGGAPNVLIVLAIIGVLAAGSVGVVRMRTRRSRR